MTPFANLIGSPIAHSLSPLIHRFWLERTGIEGDYRAVEIFPGGLSHYIARSRCDPLWRGCNVTAPLKQCIAGLVDDLDPAAATVGAVNCVHREGARLIGRNTDVEGLSEALSAIPVKGGRVVIIGGGGAAKAAIRFARQAAAREIVLVVRNAECAPAGVATVPLPTAAGALQGARLIINATPLGASGGEAMPAVVLDALQAASVGAVLDMVYDPLDTRLLRRARLAGVPAIDGLAMLVGQARSSFRYFFGADPPCAGDNELRRRLVAGSRALDDVSPTR